MSALDVVDERAAAVRHAQRVSGQVAALAPMIAASQPFPAAAQQLLAARGSLESLLVRLVELELRNCLPDGDVPDEVDGLIRTALGRNAPARGSFQSRRMAAPSHASTQGRTPR
jgi:DNA-binding FrmR family transcriptional regulator